MFKQNRRVRVLGAIAIYILASAGGSVQSKVAREVTMNVGNIPTHSARKEDLLDPHGIESNLTSEYSSFVACCLL